MKAIEVSCPPCIAKVNARTIIQYRRVFMCEAHKKIYDAADVADRNREARREVSR